MLAAIFPLSAVPVLAVPVSTPAPGNAPAPAATATFGILPINSSVVFVLDDPISSSSSRKNDVVRAHLKSAIVVGSLTLAPANTPVKIDVLDAEPAQIGDVYGFVDIYFRSLHLADGRVLPLRAPTSHLTVNVSAGHQSTVGAEDTVGDIVVPYVIYHAFRKGRNFVLGAGSEIRARTEATVSVTGNGALAITTPVPIAVAGNTPHPTFSAAPLATPGEKFQPVRPSPKPTPSPTPKTSPSPEESPVHE